MQTLTSAGLVLEPLTVAHADAMFPVLADPQLYEFQDHGPPPSVEHLREVYARLETRTSPDGTQGWLNWIVCAPDAGPIGFVQATLVHATTAWIAYVFGREHWGRGHACAATRAMLEHLQREYGTTKFLAMVEAANTRSIALLERLSFRRATPREAERHAATASELLFVR